MSSSACASSSSRDDEKGAPSSREAKKITTSSSLLFSSLFYLSIVVISPPPPPPPRRRRRRRYQKCGEKSALIFSQYNVHHPSTSLSSHDERPVSPRPPRTRGWRQQQRRRPLWRDGGVFPGGGTVVLRSRALSTRPEGWIYQDEFRYVCYTFGVVSLVCTRAIPRVAHTKLCVFSFPFLLRSRALSTRPGMGWMYQDEFR